MLIDHLGLYKILTYKYVQMQNVGFEWVFCQTSHQIWSFYTRPVDHFQLYTHVLRVLCTTHKGHIFQ